MKLQETLSYLELDELPQAGTSTSQRKCACLVERVTGVKDYAIAKNGGIVADLNFTSSIKQIIEFYPISKKKEPEVPLKPEAKSEAEVRQQNIIDINEIFPESIPTPTCRESLIEFLITQRNKRTTLELKSDEQLTEMAKRFGFEL